MKRFRLLFLLLTVVLLGWVAASAAAQTARLLPETYVSDDESMTLRYPTGWVVESDQPGLFIVATSEDMLDLGNENVPAGEAAVAVLFSNADDQYLREYFVGDDPAAVLDNIIKTLFSSNTDINVEFTNPTGTIFNDLPAARSDGLFMGNHVFLMVNALGNDVYSLIIGITTVSELDKFEPKLLAIAESVNYQPPGE